MKFLIPVIFDEEFQRKTLHKKVYNFKILAESVFIRFLNFGFLYLFEPNKNFEHIFFTIQ